MTNEEAREILMSIEIQSYRDVSRQWFFSDVNEALNMAIKALEQHPCEDVLNKIRAEILQMDFDFGDFYDHTDTIKEMVLEVIYRYKAESEVSTDDKY